MGLEGVSTFAFLIRTPAGWWWSGFPPCGSIPSPEHNKIQLLLLLVPRHLSSRGHVVRHRLLALLWRGHLQVAGGHHSPARGNKSNCDRATAAAARPADQPPDVQLVDAGDPGHGGDQLGLDSGPVRREGGGASN